MVKGITKHSDQENKFSSIFYSTILANIHYLEKKICPLVAPITVSSSFHFPSFPQCLPMLLFSAPLFYSIFIQYPFRFHSRFSFISFLFCCLWFSFSGNSATETTVSPIIGFQSGSVCCMSHLKVTDAACLPAFSIQVY